MQVVKALSLPHTAERQAAAVRLLFGAFGLAVGTWGAQVPALAQRYGLEEGRLSLALLAAALGAVACLLNAPRAVARFGPRRCSQVSALLMCAVVGGALWGSGYALLLGLMLGFGVVSALLDVSINAEANQLELRSGRKLMSGMHAMFSLGCMAGALACSGLHRLGLPAAQQQLMFAVLLAPVFTAAARRLDGPGPSDPEAAPPLTLPRGAALWMGVVGMLAMVSEGAMFDWGALYLQQERHASAALGAFGFGCFSAAMTLGRLGGDRARSRLPAPRLLALSGSLSAVGMASALLAPGPAWALPGFVLVGLGLSTIVPLMFAAAGQLPNLSPAQGVASVSAVGYAGFLFGPPLIGALARGFGLSSALWVVAVFGALIALLARRVLAAP